MGKKGAVRAPLPLTQPTNDIESGNRTLATLVGTECSYYYASTVLKVIIKVNYPAVLFKKLVITPENLVNINF